MAPGKPGTILHEEGWQLITDDLGSETHRIAVAEEQVQKSLDELHAEKIKAHHKEIDGQHFIEIDAEHHNRKHFRSRRSQIQAELAKPISADPMHRESGSPPPEKPALPEKHGILHDKGWKTSDRSILGKNSNGGVRHETVYEITLATEEKAANAAAEIQERLNIKPEVSGKVVTIPARYTRGFKIVLEEAKAGKDRLTRVRSKKIRETPAAQPAPKPVNAKEGPNSASLARESGHTPAYVKKIIKDYNIKVRQGADDFIHIELGSEMSNKQANALSSYFKDAYGPWKKAKKGVAQKESYAVGKDKHGRRVILVKGFKDENPEELLKQVSNLLETGIEQRSELFRKAEQLVKEGADAAKKSKKGKGGKTGWIIAGAAAAGAVAIGLWTWLKPARQEPEDIEIKSPPPAPAAKGNSAATESSVDNDKADDKAWTASVDSSRSGAERSL